jgi:DNA-3-methyladenine glycosylase II
MDSKILAHFRKVDPILHQLALQVGDIPVLKPRPSTLYFPSLCSNIIGQQLSGKVADVFWARFLKLFPNRKPTPQKLLDIPDQSLRAIGISNSKVAFLKSLADHFVHKKIDFKNLNNLSEAEIIGELTKIKGIGPWTAEMFCMFTLARPDLFSAGDLGLKNAIKKYFPKQPDINKWSPYRTSACLILWKSLELKNNL